MLSVLLALCLMLTLLPVTALAAGDGSIDNPYTSIAEYNAAVANGQKNGQDVYLTIEGTEQAPVEFNSGNPFNITSGQSQGNDPPKLHLTLKYCTFTGRTGDSANPSFMYLSNCQSLVIENCTFDPAGDHLTYGINWNLIDIQDATVSIRDCHFKGTYQENAIKLNQRGGEDDKATDIQGHGVASIESAEIINCTFDNPQQAIILLGSAGKNDGAASPSTGAFPVTITAGEGGAYVFQAYNASAAEAAAALADPSAALASKMIIALDAGDTGAKGARGDFGTEEDFPTP